jgi:hypothetical protein
MNVYAITRFIGTRSFFLAFVLWGLVANGQTLTPIEKSREAVPGGPTEQKYDGVSFGSEGQNPLPAAPSDQPYLVWTGFQMTGSGSRVFLQTTKPITFDAKADTPGKAAKGGLTLILRNCKIHMANNRRTIDTRFFATPVSSVVARQRRADVEVRIQLRESVTTSPRMETGNNGTSFLVLDFPPGKEMDSESAVPVRSGVSLEPGVQNSDDSTDGSIIRNTTRP